MNTGQWTRRRVLRDVAAFTAGLAAPSTVWAQSPAAPVVQTPSGSLRGAVQDGIAVFRGVPFAEAPVGRLRFRAPVPIAPWTGVRDALKSAPAAMQPGRSDTSEDCLYLNVFAPAARDTSLQNRKLPVFVWIHGGGFTGGSPSDAIFDGTGFGKADVVVVTVAYRLGVFGFLDWSPILGSSYADSANNALRDLICGLQWVQKNIASFGGDPARVTIGGESAGAKLCGMLMGIAEARPLFAQTILESGGAERIRSQANSQEVTAVFAKQLPGTHGDVREASAATLLTAQRALVDAWDGNFPLRAQSGGTLLPHRALEPIAQGYTRGKRMLLGTNRDESALFLGDRASAPLTQRNLGNLALAKFEPVFAAYQKLYPEMTPAQRNIRALSAEEYWLPSIRLAEAHVEGGGSAWFYRLDEEAASGRYKGEAYHSFDLGFVWERLAKSEPEGAQTLSRQMHEAWAAFIKSGTPAASGLPTWPQWNPRTRPTMLLADRSRVEEKPFEPELRLWDGFAFS